jgi:hypothetical protein
VRKGFRELLERGINSVDFIGNMVCLSKSFHKAWEEGRFVLYPFEAEQDKITKEWSMQLAFYWLNKLPNKQDG